MIPSQQAMMLEAALAFEHIIKNPKSGAKNGSEVSYVPCVCVCVYSVSCREMFRLHGTILESWRTILLNYNQRPTDLLQRTGD